MKFDNAIREYIKQKFTNKAKIIEITKLGSGLVADGFKVVFEDQNGKPKKVVCRRLRGVGLSRDFLADNVGYLLLQHYIAQTHPTHVNSLDIVCYGDIVKTVSLDGIEDVFQVVEFAKGESYIKYIQQIGESKKLSKDDKKIIKNIAEYLIKIHKIKPFNFSSEVIKHYYLRHSQDFIGSEVFMDILDVWDENILLKDKAKLKIMSRLFELRESLKKEYERCTMIHSDLHPDNIRIQKNLKVIPMDSARTLWGEPADDLTSMMANYIYFSFKTSESQSGAYLEALKYLINQYQRVMRDKDLEKHSQLYLPIRLLILAHPVFFSSDSKVVKRKLISLAKNILEQKTFTFEYLFSNI